MPDDSLPDFTAPSPYPRAVAPEPLEPSAPPNAGVPAPPPASPRMSAATIAALVLAGAALALSALVALVSVGAIAYLFSTASYGDAWSEFEDFSMFTQGTVEDGDGLAVDGVGTYDRPARLGEHTLSWPTEGGGVLDVTVTAVDWEADAAVAAADPTNPAPSPGMVYVQAEVRLQYAGPGFFVPATDLWLALETRSWVCYAGDVPVVPASPLWDVGDMTDGDEMNATVVFEMPEGERSTALLSVETVDGEPLYLAEH
jgi:hypothetical protein